MHSVGEKLRNERQRQNRSISAIASETCISARYLEAIEADDLSALPGGFFYKSFVKQYSGALGVDFTSVESEVDRITPAPVENPLPALSASYQVAKAEGRVSPFYTNRVAWATGLLVVALAGGGGFYRWWQKSQRTPGDAPPEPAPTQQTASAPVAQQAAPPVETPTGTPEPAATPPAVATTEAPKPEPVKTEPPVKSETAKLSVDLSAKERTWVSLSSDGKTVFSGVLDASETKNIGGIETAKLLTGNAAGLDVRWNGKSIGPLGTHGQVRIVVFTPENFQIIPARKM